MLITTIKGQSHDGKQKNIEHISEKQLGKFALMT